MTGRQTDERYNADQGYRIKNLERLLDESEDREGLLKGSVLLLTCSTIGFGILALIVIVGTL